MTVEIKGKSYPFLVKDGKPEVSVRTALDMIFGERWRDFEETRGGVSIRLKVRGKGRLFYSAEELLSLYEAVRLLQHRLPPQIKLLNLEINRYGVEYLQDWGMCK